MKNIVKRFRETTTGAPVIEVLKRATFREIMLAANFVTEGQNTDWGHTIVGPGYYQAQAVDRQVELIPVFKLSKPY